MRIPSESGDIGGHRRLLTAGIGHSARLRDHIAEEMDDRRHLERAEHAGIELLRLDDALELRPVVASAA